MSIYLDHAATTLLDPRVFAQMEPYFCQYFGNASSVHSFGQTAVHAVDRAREQVAVAIGAKSSEIYFTSGGTESDNWAIAGVMRLPQNKGNHIVTTAIEHHAVLETCRALERDGYRVTYLPVGRDGVVDIDAFAAAITPDTVLASVMHANNETGAIQPIAEMCALAHQNGVLFHTDAVQTAGILGLDVGALGVDMLSISAHKFFGPKGVGALYIRHGLRPANLLYGGSQERAMRGGTYNTPGIVGMGAAIAMATQSCATNTPYVTHLRDTFNRVVLSGVSQSYLVAPSSPRVGHISMLHFEGVPSQSLMFALDRYVAFSAGSACTAGSVEPSHVLLAMGYSESEARECVRFSFGVDNTEDEVLQAANYVVEAVARLRK